MRKKNKLIDRFDKNRKYYMEEFNRNTSLDVVSYPLDAFLFGYDLDIEVYRQLSSSYNKFIGRKKRNGSRTGW